MIGLLLLLAAVEPASAADRADAANFAFTQCLFATSRAASQARLSATAFKAKLAGSCMSEQRTVERATIDALEKRGERNAAAVVHEVTSAARADVVDSYRRALELEPQLKMIVEMCRAHPDQCRN